MTFTEQRVSRAFLAVPQAEKALFARNFIRQAVCELRFPTLFDLEGAKPPPSFAQALRKEYPHLNVVNSINLAPGQLSSTANSHTFRSKDHKWTITLRSAAVVLETSHYSSFSEFRDRLEFLLKAAEKVIDSDFFTRIGLRYINTVPYTREAIGKWINPALVGPLMEGIYGDPIEYAGRVIGLTEVGGFLFQHGVANQLNRQQSIGDLGIGQGQIPNYEAPIQLEYSLDFDLYAEDVQLVDAIKTVNRLHDLEYSFFYWALGPEAKNDLGPSKLKGESVA
ncbi:TIGR04255 family protein [Variovorax humicola]|uniref:TIGR04255 family protein n=1 Tax=Variovorax humicola TaxID=1769758 RepID=A0ABU8WC72_9BURK